MSYFSRNLCYCLWKLGFSRSDWPGAVSGWLGCDKQRAEKLLIEGAPNSLEIEALAAVLGVDAESLRFGDLLGEDKSVNIFKENLVRLFENLKHGQKKVFAEHLGVNDFTLSRWLSGDQRPTVKKIFKIKKFFAVSGELDLKTYPMFLSFQPESIAEKRDFIRQKIDNIEDDAFNNIYIALLKILN